MTDLEQLWLDIARPYFSMDTTYRYAAAIAAVAVVLIILISVAFGLSRYVSSSAAACAVQGVWETDPTASHKVMWFIDKPNAEGEVHGWVYDESPGGPINEATQFKISYTWLSRLGWRQPTVYIAHTTQNETTDQTFVLDPCEGTLTGSNTKLFRNAAATAAAFEKETDYVPI